MAVPYSRLAPGYDAVMAHVDYDGWARHILAILDRHAPEAQEVIEIGCGTGSLALAMWEISELDLRGYDGSAPMVEVAQRKAALAEADVQFGRLDFQDPIPGPLADAIVLVYDGLNYLLEEAEIARMFERVHAALRPGGVFVFDQSTPANSLNHTGEFDDEGETDAFSYTRSGRYDEETRLHTTRFELVAGGTAYAEEHVQRAYSMDEVGALLIASPLAPEGAYDAFTLEAADETSERIHWVIRRPVTEREANA